MAVLLFWVPAVRGPKKALVLTDLHIYSSYWEFCGEKLCFACQFNVEKTCEVR